MRFASILAAAAALTVTMAAQGQKIKVSTASVPVYVTVTNAEKQLVPDLTIDDFEILDNQKPQTINVFENKAVPITTVVMLDTSGSMTGNMSFLKEGVEQFLLRLLPEDRAQVGEFSDKIKFHPGEFIDNRDRLIYMLKNELDFGYPTRLWDAADESVQRLEAEPGRKVVVLFTDGDDTSSKVGVGRVMDHAREKDIMIYGVGFVSEYFNGQHMTRSQPDRGLKKLVEDTGGGYFELKKSADLNETFTRVAQELHSQYVLGFSPEALDGKVHKLDVRVKKPGMTARARKTYLAASAGTQ